MITTRKHTGCIKALSLIFFFLLTSQLLNRAVFTHAHKLSDGQVVTHAHPFNKNSDSTPFKTHHHSSIQFSVLDQHEQLFSEEALTTSAVIFLLSAQFSTRKFQGLTSPPVQNCSGRAPPIAKLLKIPTI